MASGIEIAGLALAILPLVIEAAKSYNKGVHSIKNVVVTHKRDERLQEFYENFYWEVFILERSLRKIVDGLPFLCHDCKAALYSERALSMWEENEEVRHAVKFHLGGEDALDAFILVFARVLDLVDRLVDMKTSNLKVAEKVRVQFTSPDPLYIPYYDIMLNVCNRQQPVLTIDSKTSSTTEIEMRVEAHFSNDSNSSKIRRTAKQHYET